MDPLIHGRPPSEGNVALAIRGSPVNPSVRRVVVERGTQVPTTRQDVDAPSKAKTQVHQANAFLLLKPLEHRRLPVRPELRQAGQTHEPRQPRNPLQPEGPDALVRRDLAGDPLDHHLDHLLRDASDEVDGKVCRQVVRRDGAQIVNFLSILVVIRKEEVGDEIHPEHDRHECVERRPLAVALGVWPLPLQFFGRLSVRHVDAELDEAQPVQEDGACVGQQRGDEDEPKGPEGVALMHNEGAAASGFLLRILRIVEERLIGEGHGARPEGRVMPIGARVGMPLGARVLRRIAEGARPAEHVRSRRSRRRTPGGWARP
mmetsp:Transcript_17646/g.50252  ORF Transcript_17646/g.50252 Transcript_17646/m.50252 type:complete len:317 (-) Transcript_17646:10-960(-)